MQNRETIKWAPFNSVINGNYLVENIEYEKNKIIKPALSEEQINIIEKMIIEAYIDQNKVKLQLYKNGYLNYIIGLVTKIDSVHKFIVINNNKVIYFIDILKVTVDYS